VRPVTNGERLFLLLREDLLEASGRGHIKWSNLGELFEQVGGNAHFGEYFRGAAAVHIMRRLLRFWEDERLQVGQEAQYVARISSFIREDVLTGLGESDIARLSRAVIKAESSSRQTISAGLRARIVAGRQRIQCYLCTKVLSPSAPHNQADCLTLEHLWPQSVGGDSIEENLLPACLECQKTTKDTLSWEWLNVQNFVLPPNPSRSALQSVPKKARFARHFLEAMSRAQEAGLTLKDAFASLGPIPEEIGCIATRKPITFFDLTTT